VPVLKIIVSLTEIRREASPVAYFEWTSAIELGHPQIDEQHKRLLLLCAAVIGPLINSGEPDPGTAQLQALIDFTQEHFAFEEGLMLSAGYPEAEQHAVYHASLLEEFRTYCYNVQLGQNTNPVEMNSFFWDWLVLHIDSADRELVAWLRLVDPDLPR
jgi:hemerythrin